MESCASDSLSLAYTEPKLTLILTVGGFIVLLNAIGSILDKWIHSGLIGQLILGALLGTPLAHLFPLYIEQSIQVLGYLGLLLLLAEGGMDARLDILFVPSNFFLSLLVGITGIVLPISLSMALLPKGFGYSYLQSFSVGAALSSTSLGTILALLSSVNSNASKQVPDKKEPPQSDDQDQRSDSKVSSEEGGLISTRLGSVLIGAALLDDIVALVLSSVVSNLGPSQINGIKPWTAARPVVSSALLLIVTAIVGRFFIRPTIRGAIGKKDFNTSRVRSFMEKLSNVSIRATATISWVIVVGVYVTIAHEIGSTMLLGIFCAGALMKYSHGILVQTLQESSISSNQFIVNTSPIMAFETIKPIQTKLLVPFFFSSIGSSVPLKAMFSGRTVWKGFVYAGLCAFGKLIAGFWLMIADAFVSRKTKPEFKVNNTSLELREVGNGVQVEDEDEIEVERQSSPNNNESSDQDINLASVPKTSKARSWAPSMLLGLSLVARGEIGFIILNISREAGIIGGCSTGNGAEAFEAGVWSIVLNTLGGPIAVGILLRSKGLIEEIMSGHWGRA